MLGNCEGIWSIPLCGFGSYENEAWVELSLVNSGMVERQFSGLRTLVEQSVDMSQSTKSDTVARCLAVTNELTPLLLAFSSFPLRTE